MRLTPTEQKFYDLLSDGLPHPARELVALLDDDLALPSSIAAHLTNLRGKIERRGESVQCVKGSYRLVRLMSSAYDGVR